jgi:hypothetical protein
MSPRQPTAPTLKLATALEHCEPLGQLLRRLHEARAHFEAISPLLPPALRADVRPGPVDGACWTLLAAHNPAAAKLRQMLPHLLQRLQEQGWQGTSIKVRVQPRQPSV